MGCHFAEAVRGGRMPAPELFEAGQCLGGDVATCCRAASGTIDPHKQAQTLVESYLAVRGQDNPQAYLGLLGGISDFEVKFGEKLI